MFRSSRALLLALFAWMSIAAAADSPDATHWRPVLDSAAIELTDVVRHEDRPAVRVKAWLEPIGDDALKGPITGALGRLDDDGVLDLVVSHQLESGRGALMVYLGNPDYRLSYYQKQELIRMGYPEPAPFRQHAHMVQLPVAADLVAIGDFDGDAHQDVLATSEGLDYLMLVRGDGLGRLPDQVERLPLHGNVTAMTTGEVNRRDGVLDVAVAVTGEDGPKVHILQSPYGALVAEPEVISFTKPVRALGMGQLDLGLPSLVVATERELFVVPGRDADRDGPTPQTHPLLAAAKRRIPVADEAIDVAVDNLHGDGLDEIAVVTRSGEIRVYDGQLEQVLLHQPGSTKGTSTQQLVTARWGGKGQWLTSVRPNGLVALSSTSKSAGSMRGTRLSDVDHHTRVKKVIAGRLDGDALDELVYLLDSQIDPVVVQGKRAATPLVVNDPGDTDGAVCGASCTFRQAINQANADPGTDTIVFDPALGIDTRISPATQLPGLTDAVIVDGIQAQGFISWPTKLEGGSCSSSSCGGLLLGADGTTIQGMHVYGFDSFGLMVFKSDDSVITGCRIGHLDDGVSDAGNGDGIAITEGSGNEVGGANLADRNYIAGNDGRGVKIGSGAGVPSDAAGNRIIGNFIGVDLSGTVSRYNLLQAVQISDAFNTVVGEAGAGNLISGTAESQYMVPAIELRTTNGDLIQGNILGLAQDGLTPLPNSIGIYMASSTSLGVGGAVAGQGNTISANTFDGVRITEGSSGVNIFGNLIGVGGDGSTAAGNADYGITLSDASFVQIGGLTAADGNTIANNGSTGIRLSGDNSSNGILIRRNRIFNNGSLGIDIGTFGADANDPLDSDTGPNSLQNHPVILVADSFTAGVEVSLDSLPSTEFLLHVYSSTSCDPSGYGEGAEHLVSAVASTDASGFLTMTLNDLPIAPGDVLTALATDRLLWNTSEFSPCFTVVDGSLIFADGFESANTSKWSSAVGQ